MIAKYELLQSISQGKNGTLSCENAELALITNDIIRATTSGRNNEEKPDDCETDAIIINEKEQRAAEDWAIRENRWIPFSDVFVLGLPGPSGSESDTYLSLDGYVYKQNNLLHCSGSIVNALLRFMHINKWKNLRGSSESRRFIAFCYWYIILFFTSSPTNPNGRDPSALDLRT